AGAADGGQAVRPRRRAGVPADHGRPDEPPPGGCRPRRRRQPGLQHPPLAAARRPGAGRGRQPPSPAVRRHPLRRHRDRPAGPVRAPHRRPAVRQRPRRPRRRPAVRPGRRGDPPPHRRAGAGPRRRRRARRRRPAHRRGRPVTTPAGTDTGADLVDLAALARWMDDRDLPGGPITGATVLPGGTQNLLLRFERGGRSYVLRRGPRHLRRTSNEVMRREARVLRALAGTDVPHPAFVAGPGEPDEGVTDAVFYLMAPVDGVNPTVELPAPIAEDPDGRRRFGLSVADAAARLGAVDHVAVGLADFGRPEGFLERQVPRWMAELEGYGELPGYPGPDIPGLDEVASWLEANRPTSWRPGIMHGDFHVANVLVAPDRPEVAAIVDWEMCTIGDPLLDLGWLLATWPIGPADDGSRVSPGAPDDSLASL